MAFAAISALLLTAFPAIACSCVAYPTLCELLISSRTVFIGTALTGTEPDDVQEHRGYGEFKATMRVETNMRGLPEGTTSVLHEALRGEISSSQRFIDFDVALQNLRQQVRQSDTPLFRLL